MFTNLEEESLNDLFNFRLILPYANATMAGLGFIIMALIQRYPHLSCASAHNARIFLLNYI